MSAAKMFAIWSKHHHWAKIVGGSIIVPFWRLPLFACPLASATSHSLLGNSSKKRSFSSGRVVWSSLVWLCVCVSLPAHTLSINRQGKFFSINFPSHLALHRSQSTLPFFLHPSDSQSSEWKVRIIICRSLSLSLSLFLIILFCMHHAEAKKNIQAVGKCMKSDETHQWEQKREGKPIHLNKLVRSTTTIITGHFTIEWTPPVFFHHFSLFSLWRWCTVKSRIVSGREKDAWTKPRPKSRNDSSSNDFAPKSWSSNVRSKSTHFALHFQTTVTTKFWAFDLLKINYSYFCLFESKCLFFFLGKRSKLCVRHFLCFLCTGKFFSRSAMQMRWLIFQLPIFLLYFTLPFLFFYHQSFCV